MGTIDLIPSVNFSNPLDIEKANVGIYSNFMVLWRQKSHCLTRIHKKEDN